MTDTADFGFTRIPISEKTEKVKNVFRSVADRYDLMNDAMTLGMHRLWKKIFLTICSPHPQKSLLDVAGGTGDIGLSYFSKTNGQARVVLSDINEAMLNVGRRRAWDKGWLENPEWVCASAEALPFADRSFDLCTIVFGLRNITHREQALSEMHRILKPGGRFLCMEFCPKPWKMIQKPYDVYSFRVIPQLGQWLANDRASYDYLVQSIRCFPEPEMLSGMMEQVGFNKVRYHSLNFGIVAIHSGWKDWDGKAEDENTEFQGTAS